MIWFFTPYSFEKKLFDAWDQYMNLIDDPEDWACMMDGDVFFFHRNFGHILQQYIDKYPDTGIFSCYASRTGGSWMLPPNNIKNNINILRHKRMADSIFRKHHLQVIDLNKKVHGHLMLIKKATWLQIRDSVKEQTKENKILGIDVRVSNKVLKIPKKIRLMKGVYIFHYYRLDNEGRTTLL